MTMTTDWEVACYDDFAANPWALNSAVECHPHTVEVVGSNPTAPTIVIPVPHSHLRVAGCSVLPQFSPMPAR